ncbi:CPXCG motif-containing cysteine-rich protein [Kaarinaea lacus]
MDYLSSYTVSCPYCGESFETSIDTSQGNQAYIEDCYVCCRPIQFYLEVDHSGDIAGVRVQRDDE